MLYSGVFIILSFIFLRPVTDAIIDRSDCPDIFSVVLSNPYTLSYPEYFTCSKVAWIIALLCGFVGFNAPLCLYAIVYMLLIGTFETMADTADWDYVWLVSNAVAMYFVSFYFVYELFSKQNHFSWKNLKKSRLWLIVLLVFLVWKPIRIDGTICDWDFSMEQFISNNAGTSFVCVGPSLLIMLILFYPHVNKSLFGLLTFVTSLLGSISLAVAISKSQIPFAIMHIPVLFVSLYGYYLYFGTENEIEKSEQSEQREQSEQKEKLE